MSSLPLSHVIYVIWQSRGAPSHYIPFIATRRSGADPYEALRPASVDDGVHQAQVLVRGGVDGSSVRIPRRAPINIYVPS